MLDGNEIPAGGEGRIAVNIRVGSQSQHVRKVVRVTTNDEKLANFELTVLANVSADVEILLEARTNVTRIPTAALQEGGRVLLLDGDGKLVARTVKPGLANWEFTEVLEGLTAGDRIVLSLEKEGIKPGVRVTEDNSTEKK